MTKELIVILHAILQNESDRKELVELFLKKLYGDENNEENEIMEILIELGIDLEYYVSDPVMRKENESYFGDEVLETEIKVTLGKIDTIVSKLTNNKKRSI
jgi:hypothetical protein